MLEQTYEKLWEFVKFRHPAAATADETARDWLLDEVGTYIRNYCAIVHIPVTTPGIKDKEGNPRPGGLFYVWAGLAVDVLRYWEKQAEQENDDEDPDFSIDPSDLSEIKLGDTTVRRGGQLDSTRTGQINNQHMPNLDNYVYNYQHTLNQFRDFRW